MDLSEMECEEDVDWVNVAQFSFQWWALVNLVKILQVP
jgi:hypothetical protein